MVSTMTNVETMKVPEGYKQTEVGVKNSSGTNFNDACGGPKGGGMDSRRIPEDWSIKTIGSALTIRHGRDQKQVQCSDGVYPILGTGGEMGRSNTFIYDKPSVLIGRKGSINKPRFMDTPFWTVDTLFYSEVNANYSAKFLFYKFCMIDWMNYNEASGVPSLNATTIESVFLSYPQDKQEQETIANALSDVDNLIAALETLIAKKSAIKTAAMQQLLTGKKRLPAFAGERESQHLKANEQCNAKPNEQHRTQPNSASDTPAQHHSDAENNHQHTPRPGYKHTELGEIPEDWEVVEFGELLKYEQPTKYLVRSAEYMETGVIPVLTAGKSFVLGYTTEVNNLFTNLPVIIFDDFTTDSKYVDFKFKVKSSAMKMLIPKNSSSPVNLIHSILSSVDFKVGDHKRHWISEFSKLKVRWPKNIKEQTAIANVLTDMDAELDALQQRLAKTQKIKQGMMQELLTGKTRLLNQKEIGNEYSS